MALSASPTAYSAVTGKTLAEVPTLAGSSVALAVLVQTRNRARVAVLGSLELFGDHFLQAPVPVEGRCAPALLQPRCVPLSTSPNCLTEDRPIEIRRSCWQLKLRGASLFARVRSSI